MKRYKLGQRRTKTDAHGNSATMPDMIECDDGEYIKYSEYEQLLESIGAGGVSGRVTQPDQALLISMAMCLNHGFGLLDKGAQALILSDMRKLWEEVVGLGYYQPENRGMYLGMIASDDHIPDASNMMEQDADKADADRYRYLRGYRGHKATGVLLKGILFNGHDPKARTDEAIDAARKEPTK